MSRKKKQNSDDSVSEISDFDDAGEEQKESLFDKVKQAERVKKPHQ
jgi:hypothetical protein